MLKGQVLAFLLLCTSAPVQGAEGSSLQLNWNLDAGLLWSGTVAQVFGNYRLNTQKPVGSGPVSRHELLPWDSWVAGKYSSEAAFASDLLSYAALTPALVFGAHTLAGSLAAPELGVTLLVLGEAALFNSAFNLWTRSFGLHPRPYVFGEEAPLSLRERPEAAGSFYSGHASAAFMTAVFTGYVHQVRFPDSPWNKWIWVGGIGTASAIATLRVFAGKHYPSDVLAGAAMGSFFGFYLPWLHLPRKPQNRQVRLSLLPGGGQLFTSF